MGAKLLPSSAFCVDVIWLWISMVAYIYIYIYMYIYMYIYVCVCVWVLKLSLLSREIENLLQEVIWPYLVKIYHVIILYPQINQCVSVYSSWVVKVSRPLRRGIKGDYSFQYILGNVKIWCDEMLEFLQDLTQMDYLQILNFHYVKCGYFF